MKKTLSIPQFLDDFLEKNPDLSPSKMLQSKIIEIMENRRLNSAEIVRLERRMKILQEELWKSNDKIDVLENEIKVLREKVKCLEEKNK